MQSDTIPLLNYHNELAVPGCSTLMPPSTAPSFLSTASAMPDNSLTSLNWLPDFQIPSIDKLVVQHNVVSSLPALNQTPLQDDTASSSEFGNDEVEREAATEVLLPLSPLKRCMNQTAEFEQNHWKYQNNPAKPPFSYTTIIYLAIRSSKNDKVTLGEIYQWIKDHFMYYRLAESTWQNSVRHNLSLNDFFVKIPRSQGDTGKGSFWQINPDYASIVSNELEFQRLEELQNNQRLYSGNKSKGKVRRRLHSTSSNNGSNTSKNKDPQKQKRSKSTSSIAPPVNAVSEAGLINPLPTDLDWVTLLNTQRTSCGSCTGVHTCRASFGSPILGRHNLEPIDSSPTTVPLSLSHESPPIVPSTSYHHTSLDDIMTSHESPAQLLPSWAESRSQSPNVALEHPWAESRERAGRAMWGSPETTPWTIGLPLSGYPPPSSSTSAVLPVAQLI